MRKQKERKKADFHLRAAAMKPYAKDFFRRKNAETIKILKEQRKSKKECCAFAAQSCRICLIAIRFFSISTAETFLISHSFSFQLIYSLVVASYTGRSKQNAVTLPKFTAIFCAFRGNFIYFVHLYSNGKQGRALLFEKTR